MLDNFNRYVKAKDVHKLMSSFPKCGVMYRDIGNGYSIILVAPNLKLSDYIDKIYSALIKNTKAIIARVPDSVAAIYGINIPILTDVVA